MEAKTSGLSRLGSAVSGFSAVIARFFSEFGTAMAKGDLFVKLSLIWWGAGYFRRRQYVKAILMTLLEIAVIVFTLNFAMSYVPKFGTLGTVQAEQVFNIQTMQTEWNDYDNSFMILLCSLFSFVIWFIAAVVCLRNVVNAYELQLRAQRGKHINTFVEDMKEYLDQKFHITLLSLPVLGVVVFTLIPMLLILVAFTNYDQQHMPPTNLFSWVGLSNFVALFGGNITSTFGYAFVRVLGWTIVWSFLATLTTYFGSILMSLLLMRNFFANTGIMNAICAKIGLTGFLRSIGLISTSYIPFLSAPIWAHVMIILINIWVGIPYQMLIATGVLMNLPTDQLESARIDGASPFQIFKSITMPYML